MSGDHATRTPAPVDRAPVLDVAGLSVDIGGRRLVDDVHLQLLPGQRLGLIGESGSGKSLTALSLLGLLPPKARTTGSLLLHGREVARLPESEWRRLRGARIAMVFQDAVSALNPLVRVQRHIAEPLRKHRGMAGPRARTRARALLHRVGFSDAERAARCTPAQLSGGQRQRVALAMALACRPAVLVADEPTTALDVTVQAEILQLLADVTGGEDGPALLLISHDLPVVAQLCSTVMVMHEGAVVERGALTEMLRGPRHPRTAALVDSARQLESPRARALPERAARERTA
ncbi:ABC transporter ATP-binding protein [Bounagaea algeriensis]